MNRREKLLHGISVQNSVGVEIGALCRPFLNRDDGEVIYVDHADTVTLQEKYRNDPDVQPDKIVYVDAVWGENTLFEAIGKKVDYVVASHVVEHVPDLIGWFKELQSILVNGGEVRLIIPDKRFTYDYLRHETRLPDVVYAHLIKARAPQPHVVHEYVMNVVKLDGSLAWRGQVDDRMLEYHHPLQHAENCALNVLRNGKYHDVHCWVFTPCSFGLLMADLATRGLITFECTDFFDTEPDTNEFFVGLRPTNNIERAKSSWLALVASSVDVQTQLHCGHAKPVDTSKEKVDGMAAYEELTRLRASRTWKLVSALIRANLSARKFLGIERS